MRSARKKTTSGLMSSWQAEDSFSVRKGSCIVLRVTTITQGCNVNLLTCTASFDIPCLLSCMLAEALINALCKQSVLPCSMHHGMLD